MLKSITPLILPVVIKRLLCLMISFFPFVAFSQSAESMNILEQLTSEEFAGRGYVEDGQEKAADFLVGKLKAYGVEPVNSVYRQEVSYSVNTFPQKMNVAINGVALRASEEFIVHPASASFSGELTITPFSGSGFEQVKQSKKEAFIVWADTLSADEKRRFPNDYLFISGLKKRVLIVAQSQKLTWWPSTEVGDNTIIYWKTDSVTAQNLGTANLTIDASFKPKITSNNVMGFVKGQNSDSAILYMAHYDHLGKMGSANLFPGANDNASGVAVVMAVAQELTKHKPLYDSYFLLTTGEELGLLGSYQFLTNPPMDVRKLKWVFNLDISGTGDEGIMVVNGKKYPKEKALIDRINEEKDLFVEVKERGEACNSDHCYFNQAGLKSFYFYTVGGKKAYHDTDDRLSGLSLKAFDSLVTLLIDLPARL